MWCGDLFLEVFASHFCQTSPRVSIPELDSERQDLKGAMALAAAAVGDVPLSLFLRSYNRTA